MGKIFYISDWHYGHEHVMHFDNRPFVSVSDMNQSLIDRWNSVVENDDDVYVLGDMFWCNNKEAIEVLNSLHGKIHLIKGNHDKCDNAQFREKFVEVVEYKEIIDDDRHVVLCHYPIPCFKNHFYGWIHLYGHVHTSFEYNMMEHNKYLMKELYTKECEMYNVGCMLPYMDYTPRTLTEILTGGTNL